MTATTLIVATLNELDGLTKIMPQIKKEWCDQIIILDGHSTDGSTEWCRNQGYEIFIGEKDLWSGYRNLFNSGMVKGDIVITFSPDNNSIPEKIPYLIERMKQGYDMVIASRYLYPAKSADDSKITRIGNWILTQLVNVRSKFKYTDALVIYRAYRTELLKKVGLLDEPSKLQRKLMTMSGLFSFEPSLSVRLGNMKVAEIPADEPHAFREKRREHFIKHGAMLITQIVYENWLRK